MAWHYNKSVDMTFVHHTTQYAYASISGLGWKRIKNSSADGCTNLVVLMNAAKANSRPVHVNVDSSNMIVTAYLV